MNIAVIKSGVVVDVAQFVDVQTAQSFLDLGVWSNAESVIELPEGYGIGDSYENSVWTKVKKADVMPSSLNEQIRLLEEQNIKQSATIKALTASAQTLEDCLVEMAGIVYA